MRLFQITDTITKTRVEDSGYFDSKPKAKIERARLNKEHEAELRFVVSPGPDHHKYHE